MEGLIEEKKRNITAVLRGAGDILNSTTEKDKQFTSKDKNNYAGVFSTFKVSLYFYLEWNSAF